MLATSTVLRSPKKPAWQTEELEDEWIEPSSAHDSHAPAHSHSNIPRLSLAGVAPPSPTLSLHHSPPSLTPPGTFLIREDQPAAPILPKPLGKSRSKSLIKDFFSPLALETMFEPPSPRTVQGSQPAVPSRLTEVPLGVEKQTELVQSEEHESNHSLGEDDMEEETNAAKIGDGGHEHELLDEGEEDVILTSDIPNLASFDGRKPSAAYKFTFSAPQRPAHMSNTIAKSTPTPAPTPARIPATDPRLRLFQFQYDTYTREHLSAMVDSIAVNTPSSDASKTTPRQTGAATESDVGFIRATKRLRLTPPQDVSNAPRPRRDYVGESRHLMQKIKQARTPSMMTTLSIKENIQPTNVEDHSIVEDRPRRLPLGDARSVWSSDTPSEISSSAVETDKSRHPSSMLQPSAAYASSSLLPVYPTSTLTPSIPSSLFSSTSNSLSKPSSNASALGYRRQAADLMAQIRKDMTTGKRLVSLEIPKDDGAEKSQPASPVLQRKPSRITLSPRKDRTKSTDSEKPPLPIVRKVPKPSPRKLLRRLSAADEVDRELALNKSGSDASLGAVEAPEIDPKHLPIASPSPSPAPQLSRQPPPIQVFHVSDHAPNPAFLLPQAPGDGGRVVSGGTTTSVATTDTALTRGTSATSVSAGSVGSFVKHPGPVQMMRIAPSDLPSLPDTVGGMRFDREMMRWVKDEVKGSGDAAAPEESEDPFKSFESLESGKEDEVEEPQAGELEESPAGLLDAIRDEQADEDTDDSFEFDAEGSAAAVVEVMTGIDSRDSETETETTDSEAGDAQPDVPVGETVEQSEDEDQADPEDVTAKIPAPAPATTTNATPIPPHREPRAPPRSALKQTSGPTQEKTPAAALRTPNNLFSAAHRRSVSFSDGRKDGKIQGLGREGRIEGPSPVFPASGSGSTFVPSARGNRIAAILENFLEPSFEEQTPSKASTSVRPPSGAIQPLASRSQSQSQLVAGATRRTFARSQGGKELSLAQGNQTFLTECSFGVAQDKLVQVITDVHPYVPYWESLLEIDLSEKGVDSVVRLKEFLPQLDALKIDVNMLSWLTGVPKTVRTLSVATNSLTAMTSFSHLTNLENLDISNNQIDSLKQLSCLRHLRELKADGNSITSLDGLADLDGLTKLSLKGNRISEVDLAELRWPRVEVLNLSRNKLCRVEGLGSLTSLTALNLDHNRLEVLEADGPMTKVRTLRVSDNRLVRLDTSRFTGLRTLYADNNRLCEIRGIQRLRKLENLSLRNQGGKGLTLATRDIRDIKRLYLSGNPLVSSFIEEPCYNLIYLEVAACRLTALPLDLARLVPNVRVLNLNYNFLTEVRALDGLTRLRKLTLIGSRLTGTKSLVRMLRRMPEIEMLDCRMNPCTLGWYLPILVQGVPGALQPSEDAPAEGGGARIGAAGGGSSSSWQDLDAKFRRGLPDQAYVGRLAYRGLVMRACSKVKMLDGVAVEGSEREKAERLLAGVLGAAGRARAE